MTLASNRLCIASLGCFCQTAHQLIAQRDEISSSLRIPLHASPQFFDWISAPVSSIAALMSCFTLPKSPGSLLIKNQSPFWPDLSLYMTHQFRVGGYMAGEIDIAGTWDRNIRLLHHLREKWLDLEQIGDEFIFVISNTQGNIINNVVSAAEFPAFLFTEKRIREVLEALQLRFGSRLIGLLVVEDTSSDSGRWHLPGVTRRNIGPPVYEWQGNSDAWRAMLTDALPLMMGRHNEMANSEVAK